MRKIVVDDIGTDFEDNMPYFRIELGCKNFITKGKAATIDLLKKYITDPEGTENEFYRKFKGDEIRPNTNRYDNTKEETQTSIGGLR